jgi:hypothetical protein
MKFLPTLVFAVLLTIYCAKVSAQSISEIEPRLASLAFTMVKDSVAENRQIAADSFKILLNKALKQKNAFGYPFELLENISIKAPADSAFRIFTWQIVDKKGNSVYSGIIQTKNKIPKVFELTDKSEEIENPEFETCSPDNWYGGLYYNLKTFNGKFGKQYLLFGYNQRPIYERIKFVDVLTFKAGKFTFGAPVFTQKDKETRKRFIMTYGAEGKARLNFDESSQQIIFDHLVSVKHELLGLTLVPDGDFEGYKLEKGLWNYVNDAVKTTPVDTPDRPFPILDNRKGKNVFGKKKGKLN